MRTSPSPCLVPLIEVRPVNLAAWLDGTKDRDRERPPHARSASPSTTMTSITRWNQPTLRASTARPSPETGASPRRMDADLLVSEHDGHDAREEPAEAQRGEGQRQRGALRGFLPQSHLVAAQAEHPPHLPPPAVLTQERATPAAGAVGGALGMGGAQGDARVHGPFLASREAFPPAAGRVIAEARFRLVDSSRMPLRACAS